MRFVLCTALQMFLLYGKSKHHFTMQSLICEQSPPRAFMKGQENIWFIDFLILSRPDASLGGHYWPLGKSDAFLVIGTERVIAQSLRQNGRVFQDGTHPPSTIRACPGTRTSSLIFIKTQGKLSISQWEQVSLAVWPIMRFQFPR